MTTKVELLEGIHYSHKAVFSETPDWLLKCIEKKRIVIFHTGVTTSIYVKGKATEELDKERLKRLQFYMATEGQHWLAAVLSESMLVPGDELEMLGNGHLRLIKNVKNPYEELEAKMKVEQVLKPWRR